jgi:hypothetical protein
MVPSTTTITIRSRGSVERRDGGTAGGANHITARSKTVPLGAASMTIVCFPLKRSPWRLFSDLCLIASERGTSLYQLVLGSLSFLPT